MRYVTSSSCVSRLLRSQTDSLLGLGEGLLKSYGLSSFEVFLSDDCHLAV
jgi:hypothetical protein